MKAKYTEAEFKTLPEPLQKELRQGEDKHYYPVIEASDDGWAFENVANLRNTMREERNRREQWERKHAELTATLAGADPEDVKKIGELKRKLKEMETWQPDEKVAQRISGIESEYKSKLTAAEQEKEKSARELEGEVAELLIDDRARAHLVKIDAVDPELLLPHVRRQTRVVKNPTTKRREVIVVDAHGDPVPTKRPGAVGNMQLDELLEGYKKTWPNAFKGSSASGGGAGTSPGAGGSGNSNGTHPSAGDAGKLTPEQRLIQLRRQGSRGAAS